MSHQLPNEIILRISTIVSKDSTLDLKPLSLLNRRWRAVVGPVLLATVSVSTLRQVVELCDQITCFNRSETFPSSVAKYAKTIVISGTIWEAGAADCHFGLEDLGEQPRGENEGETPVEPDIDISSQDVSEKVRASFPHLTSLDGLEWYGRFAGDYCLVRFLQRSGMIRRLAYGVDLFVSTTSPAYCNNAFQFTGLKSLSITSEYEPEEEFFAHAVEMMHRNPGLQTILLDCKFAESMSGRWSLLDMICDNSSPSADKPIFVWPDLQHLTLRFFKGAFWQSAEEVEVLAKFLIAHPKLETLFLHETCLEDSESETAQPLSLASHPDSLPCLKKLLGSPRLLAGVLESRAALASVRTVIDESEEGLDDGGAKAPYIERILSALEKVPENQIRRLRLEVPQLNRGLYTKFAQLAPNVRFLEFLRPLDLDYTTPQDESFDPVVDIPSGLNEFPNLGIIGQHIVGDFIKASNKGNDGLLELARQVPRLKHVHGGNGILVTFTRGPNGEPSLLDGVEYLDNQDYDWMTFEVDWRHRPMSHRAIERVRESEGVTVSFR